MSITALWNRIVTFIKNFPEFIEQNYANPILWIGIFLVLLIIGKLAINAFSDK